MKKKYLVLLFALLPWLYSCHKSTYFSDIQPIPEETWKTSAPLTFTLHIEDPMAYYNMYIHLRNSTDFETQNFYVFMKTQYPTGHAEQDTLGFILCDKFGKWTGKGQGRIKDNKFLFQPKVRFPIAGDYTFTVIQGMRADQVKGISDFGISLEHWTEKK